jgi:prephenate dehydratase
MSKSLVTISYQGRDGAFTHQALKQAMQGRDSWAAQGKNEFDDVVRGFENGNVSEMFLATENNNSGRVDAMIRLMPRVNGWIVREHFLPVQQCLLGVKGTNIKSIKEVWSQKPALDQCLENIHRHQFAKRDQKDTALAAENISKAKRPDLAAIASPLAATIYGLDILDKDFADNPGRNFTRFFHIVHPGKFAEFVPKYSEGESFLTTIIVKGHLLSPKCLMILSNHHVHISRFENLPYGDFGPNLFMLDVDGHMKASNIKKCFNALGMESLEVRPIGCYRAQKRPDPFKQPITAPRQAGQPKALELLL